MRNDTSVPLTHPLRRAAVCVVDGYGVKVCVQRGQLVVEDGIGLERRTRIYARATHGINRFILIGTAGFISLEAIRWLADLGIPLIHLDRDGRVLSASAVGGGDARLRRLQANAATNATGLEITRMLLKRKLSGQRRVLAELEPRVETSGAFETAADGLGSAQTIEELVFAERDAAIIYWASWAAEPVGFTRKDERLVPVHWMRFGLRGSTLTSGPRLAINPANAMLNYLYAVLEAETRVASLTAGLDPGLGIVHVDYRSRDSFALDVMEAVRPDVDLYVLRLLRSRLFTRSDFGETSRGVCRVLAPFSHSLSGTAREWGTNVAPIVEAVLNTLISDPDSRIAKLVTPLTGANRQSRYARQRQPKTRPNLPATAATRACKRCGGGVPRPSRVYCDACLPHYQREQYANAFDGSGLSAIREKKMLGADPTHGGLAARRRAQTNIERKGQLRDWEARHGKLLELSGFRREILPLIQGIPLSQLQRATGLSLRYVSQIRRGERTPHPRHWTAFVQASETSSSDSRMI